MIKFIWWYNNSKGGAQWETKVRRIRPRGRSRRKQNRERSKKGSRIK